MYRILILDAATRGLARLATPISSRVVERIRWLAEHLDAMKLEALTGDLTGLYKLRAGDYRVFYEILQDERTIVIHMVGHRRDIYRKR